MIWLFLSCSASEPVPLTVGDTMVMALQSDFGSLNPVTAQAAVDHDLIDTLNRHLVRFGFDCGLTFEPDLVSEWTFSEDSTALHMKLRPDAMWSDGTPVTSRDVAFTYELVADDQVASPRRATIENMDPDMRVEVVSDTEFTFHFTHAYDRTTMLAHASLVRLVPEHALKSADRATLRGHAFSREPVLNGPWDIVTWEPNQRVVIEPREAWWGAEEDTPKLARVIFKVLPEYATRLMELENGSVDLAASLEVADADRLAVEHPEIRLERRGWRSTDYLAWNGLDAASYGETLERMGPADMDWAEVTPHPIFSDADTRRALSMAIDVDKLIADLLTSQATGEVYGKRAVSTVSPEICAYHNEDLVPTPNDTTAAKALLAERGWVDTDGDGILDRDGQPFSFTLLTNSGNPRRAKAAIIIQANLADVGVEMNIEKLESNTFFSRLRKKDFEAALSGWSASTFVDMSNLWHSGHSSGQNYPNYDNPQVDALIEEALRTPDPEKAQALWKQVQAQVHADQPYTFLYWRDDIVGVSDRFESADVDFLYPYNHLERWDVPPDKVRYRR
ncbi:MAG: hypothetical protein GY913_23120 [Proteobacteria bacterium]|nr:hypothetical protein [Pseudomonadota bacterium]MCP4919804.1 hypothetical protein [Pseudomonadota bacterium]